MDMRHWLPGGVYYERERASRRAQADGGSPDAASSGVVLSARRPAWQQVETSGLCLACRELFPIGQRLIVVEVCGERIGLLCPRCHGSAEEVKR